MVEVEYCPGTALQRALLKVRVGANVELRSMAIGFRRPLLECRRWPRIEAEVPELAGLHIHAQEPTWAHELLALGEARTALGRIMGGGDAVGLREVYVQPGRVWLRARPSAQVTPEQAGVWVEALVGLAKAAGG